MVPWDIYRQGFSGVVNWRGLDNFYQTLETSERSIFQAEIITLDRVAVTPGAVGSVMDTRSSFKSFFPSARVTTSGVGWSWP